MTLRNLLGHLLILTGTVAGIIGFGLMFDGFSGGSYQYFYVGIPLLFAALWWVGRDLARSNLAARRRRLLKHRHVPRAQVDLSI